MASLFPGLGGSIRFLRPNDSRLEIPYSPSLVPTSAFTFECLFRATSIGVIQALGSHHLWTSSPWGFAVKGNNKIELTVNTATTRHRCRGETALELGTIYHLAARWDGSELSVLLNGEVDKSLAFAEPLKATTKELTLGGDRSNPAAADVDEIRLWHVARSDNQIQARMHEPLPSGDRSGLVLYLQLDEGSGTVAQDASGLGHHATLINNPQWVPGDPVNPPDPPVDPPVIEPHSLAEVLRGGYPLMYLLDVTLYDPESDQTQVRTYGTRDWTSSPGDPTTANLYYPDRLNPPTLSWSRVAGDRIGGATAADEGRFEIYDLARQDSDIATNNLTVKGQPLLLRIGTPTHHLADMLSFHAVGSRIYPRPEGDGWIVEYRSKDALMDGHIPRRRTRGLGECLLLTGGHHAVIRHSGTLSAFGDLQVSIIVEPLASGLGFEQVIASKEGEWELVITTGNHPRFRLFGDSGTPHDVTGTDPLAPGRIVHLTGRRKEAALSLWVNAVVVAAVEIPRDVATGSADVWIGNDNGGLRPLNAKIDELRIYNQALDDEEIVATNLRPLPQEQWEQPQCYLPMNEGLGADAFDEGLHNNDAVLHPYAPEATPPGDPPDDPPDDPAASGALWSSLYEGDQPGLLRPFPVGSLEHVPPLWLSTKLRILQIYDGAAFTPEEIAAVGVGPLRHGARAMRPKRQWVAVDLRFIPAAGLSVSRPIDRIKTAGEVDFRGLVRGQWVKISGTAHNNVRAKVFQHSDVRTLYLPGGTLSNEEPSGPVAIETTGFYGQGNDLTFSANSRTITTAGSMDFSELIVGQSFEVVGGLNAGTYTLDEPPTSREVRVAEEIQNQDAGTAITIEGEEIYDYTLDLERGLLFLEFHPSAPLGCAVRGPGGATRGEQMLYLARKMGYADHEMDIPSFENLTSIDVGTSGLWIGDSDREMTGREAMDRLAGLDSWGTNPFTGKLEVHRRSLPETADLELSYPQDFISIRRPTSAVPIDQQIVRYGHNPVVLGDDAILEIVRDPALGDPDFVAWVRQQFREIEVPADGSAVEKPGPVLESTYQTETAARKEAERIYRLDSTPGRAVYESETIPLPLLLNPRTEAIRITSAEHPGLIGGRLLILLNFELRGASHMLVATWWG